LPSSMYLQKTESAPLYD